MLTAVVMGLRPVAEARLPRCHGGLAYGAAMDLFLRLDPRLSRALHEGGGPKPFTVSPLVGPFRGEGGWLWVRPGEKYFWRITGLTGAVSECLGRLRAGGWGVRFGGAVLEVEEVAREGEEHPEAGRDSYEGLWARWGEGSGVGAVTLRFITPTTFREGRREEPFPLPVWVFGSLVGKWNAFGPEPLGLGREAMEGGVVLGSWRGETRRVELGRFRTVGFVGTFTYRVLEPGLGRWLGLLADFAFYAGVGWQTTRGLGQVRPGAFTPR